MLLAGVELTCRCSAEDEVTRVGADKQKGEGGDAAKAKSAKADKRQFEKRLAAMLAAAQHTNKLDLSEMGLT